MNRKSNPDTVAAPIGAYVHAVEIPPNSRTLYISGQVGIGPDGLLKEGVEAQSEQVFANILAILKANDMGLEDMVKFTSYLVNPSDLQAYRAARARAFGDFRTASTLAIVQALAGPQYLVEVEAIAAKAIPAPSVAAPARAAAKAKAPAKKAPAKRAAAKPAPVKAAVQKAPARKAAAKTVAAKPAPAKSAPAKKPAAKKAPVKKVPAKAAAPRRMPGKAARKPTRRR